MYRVLVGKPEGKRPLGRPRRRWIILGWISRRWDVGMWTGLTQSKHVADCGFKTISVI